MVDQFTIRYPNGTITLNPDFFPASKQRLGKLMRIVAISEDPELYKESLIKHIDSLLEDRRSILNSKYHNYQNNINEARKLEPKIFEKEQTLQRAKARCSEMPRGSKGKKAFKNIVDELKAELKDLKDKYNTYKRTAGKYKKQVSQADRDCTGLKMNAEVLRDYE